jgi:hypothetical protein
MMCKGAQDILRNYNRVEMKKTDRGAILPTMKTGAERQQ